VTSFLERWAGKASALATFGDSITEGLTIPEMPARWANRLASRLGARTLQPRHQRHGDAILARRRRRAARP
jgi:hypothetical protein